MSSNSGLRRPVFVFLFLSVIGDVSGVITSPPLNTVTEVGQQAIFNCTSSITLQHWALTTKREDVGTAAAADIAISCIVQPGFATHYEVDRPGGNSNVCNLIVKDVTMQQAGIYTCSDTGTGPSAILTVIDSSPMIIYNNTSDFMEGENVIITCTLNYNGSVEPASTLRPHFYWTDHTGKNVSSFYNSTPVNGPAISQIEHTAGRQDITPFTCHVYLQLISSATPGYVTNVPSVNSSASSPPITVLYIPSTPVITSRPEVITIQGVSCGISVLTCSNSTGNPAPNYRWYDSAENVILTTTNTLTLAEVNRNYKCEVYNTIRNVEYNESVTYPVSDGNCASTAQCCVFPHDETTSVTVKGCDNGTVCDCSQGSSGIILTCKADTFPNPSYMWTGPGVDVIFSSVLDKVQMNGTHHCVAYFNESLTNYTGDAKFPNGTNETTVDSCCPIWELVISFVIPYVGGNVIFLVVFLVLRLKHSAFNNLMENRFPGTTMLKTVLLSIACVCFGLIIIPIVVTIAFCSSLKQVGDVSSKPGGPYQMDGVSDRSGSRQDNGDSSAEVSNQRGGNVANAGPGIPGWSIVVMWCVGIVLLFPTAFVVVFFVPCNQMLFEIS